MTTATRKRKPVDEGGAGFDRELDDLPQELRWREWMGLIMSGTLTSSLQNIWPLASPTLHPDFRDVETFYLRQNKG